MNLAEDTLYGTRVLDFLGLFDRAIGESASKMVSWPYATALGALVGRQPRCGVVDCGSHSNIPLGFNFMVILLSFESLVHFSCHSIFREAD